MLADPYDALLFDLDGVLYRGEEAIPAAPTTLARLREAGKRTAFLTNNSSRTPERVAAKLTGLGIAAEPGEVVTSSLATADLLASRGSGTAFVLGGEGVTRALADAGLDLVDGRSGRADLVVVGIDDDLTYEGLRTACVLIQRGARLVATNADGSFPAAGGELWPGAGALVAAIVAATGTEPEIVGKPFAPLFESALRRAGGGRPLVIGDRLDTDIAGADALGWDSLLVLTGVSRRGDLDASPVRPTFVAEDVGALLERPPTVAQSMSGRRGKAEGSNRRSRPPRR